MAVPIATVTLAFGSGPAAAADASSITLTGFPTLNRPVGLFESLLAQPRDTDGQIACGTTVRFTISGANPQTGTATVGGIEARFTYTGTNPGTDTIVADFTNVAGRVVSSSALRVMWFDASSITLNILALNPPVGLTETLFAQARDTDGSLACGATVRFTISGANPQTGTGTVPDCALGARFTYTGTNPGTDTIVADFTNVAGRVVSTLRTLDWIGPPHSLALDGTTGYAEASCAKLNLTGDWTVEAWFKDEDPNGFDHDSRQLFNKGDQNSNPESPYFALILHNHLLAGVRTGGVNYPIDLDLSYAGLDPTAWHHVAVTFGADLNVLNLWVDGIHRGDLVVPAHSATGNDLSVEIGRNGPSSDKYWLGKIDDLRIWNLTRTGVDITASYIREFTDPPAGLVANWKFNETNGNTAADSPSARQVPGSLAVRASPRTCIRSLTRTGGSQGPPVLSRRDGREIGDEHDHRQAFVPRAHADVREPRLVAQGELAVAVDLVVVAAAGAVHARGVHYWIRRDAKVGPT